MSCYLPLNYRTNFRTAVFFPSIKFCRYRIYRMISSSKYVHVIANVDHWNFNSNQIFKNYRIFPQVIKISFTVEIRWISFSLNNSFPLIFLDWLKYKSWMPKNPSVLIRGLYEAFYISETIWTSVLRMLVGMWKLSIIFECLEGGGHRERGKI